MNTAAKQQFVIYVWRDCFDSTLQLVAVDNEIKRSRGFLKFWPLLSTLRRDFHFHLNATKKKSEHIFASKKSIYYHNKKNNQINQHTHLV